MWGKSSCIVNTVPGQLVYKFRKLCPQTSVETFIKLCISIQKVKKHCLPSINYLFHVCIYVHFHVIHTFSFFFLHLLCLTSLYFYLFFNNNIFFYLMYHHCMVWENTLSWTFKTWAWLEQLFVSSDQVFIKLDVCIWKILIISIITSKHLFL